MAVIGTKTGGGGGGGGAGRGGGSQAASERPIVTRQRMAKNRQTMRCIYPMGVGGYGALWGS